MSDSPVTFHKLEEYELRRDGATGERSVICSFKTRRFGYMQIGFDEGGIYQLKNEPDLHMFPTSQQDTIEACSAIVWRMVHETPAMTDRFSKP